jgi:phospholipid/cholesterol/gamma-HCH transport system ATP-binding protein
LIDERGHDDQATPPSGYEVPQGEQETVQWESPGSQQTRESQVPEPPPTEEDRVPTPWELKQEQGGQETVAEGQANPVGGAPETQVEDAPDRSDFEKENAKRRAAEVTGEAAPPSGEGDDEYKWHTDRTGRSETAESDAVEFIDVKKSFGRNAVLNGLNLGIPDDQISMILGPSGTGKSVCIKHMVGLLYPDEGDVLVHGESVPNMRDDDLFEMRKKFGVLFQDGALFGSMNLFDNVAFPLRQHTDKGEEEIVDICTRRLREVGLAGAGEKMPNELSGGMRKRAGFARALVLDPQIVLFDEPDSGLDPVRTALLCELIKEIHEENGGAYVVITHDIMSARRVAEYIAILWKGRIVESGPASELFNSDNQFVRQFLSGEARGPLGME